MCFQYKWSRSRKEKIKGKGQTKQIKLASLPDFNINYHGFGKDPSISSSKFFSQGRRIPPREERLASKYQKKVQNSGLHIEVTVFRSGVLSCLQFLPVELLKEGPPRYTRAHCQSQMHTHSG